jgi:c-di-GMP-binding flagellar brake protein YcgR|tara:strand:- start:2177 stop:2881 length:705 start_codon:yes stop_codon:yes gene_type:complete
MEVQSVNIKPNTDLGSAVDLNNLHHRFGEMVQLQLEGQEARHTVKLIGYLAGRSVIVTSPLNQGRLVAMVPGQRIQVRMMINDVACAFTSMVTHVCRSPYPYLHLEYPSGVEVNFIRNAMRVTTEVPVSVINLSIGERAKEMAGTLIDISETGARLVMPCRIGKKKDDIRLKMFLDIRGIDRVLETEAVLRGRRKTRTEQSKREVHYGIEFAPMNEEARIALIAFVYSMACVQN